MNVIYSTKTIGYHYNDKLIIKDMWDLGVSGSQIAMSIAKAQKLYEIDQCLGWSILILVDEKRLGRFKESDKETNLERLKFLINNFKQPTGFEVVYTIATVKDIPYKDTEIFTSLWPFEKQWKGGGGYVLNYKATEFGFDSYVGKTRGIHLPGQIYKDYRIEQFSYRDKWEDVLEWMIHADLVVSERTTMLAMAMWTNTPTLLVSQPKVEMFLDGEMRPILYGNGNLGMTWNVDHFTDKIEQDYFRAPLKNVAVDELEDEMRNRLR